MKVVILAGGLGSRLSEETELKPKPMVDIGDRPILWHIMKTYAHFGFDDFYVALGYKGEVIKRYFFDLSTLHRQPLHRTGQRCDQAPRPTGRKLARQPDRHRPGDPDRRSDRNGWKPYLPHAAFMVTYGDGVANVDLAALLRFHREKGRLATVASGAPTHARFGGLVLEDGLAMDFTEKPQIGEGWINGGFFVFEPQVFDYIDGDACRPGSRYAGPPGSRAPARRLSTRWLLAVYGHPPRKTPVGWAVAQRRQTLESVGGLT